MTKSEAKAIEESTVRALRALNTGMPWIDMPEALKAEILVATTVAMDELTRVYEMAKAELGKSAKKAAPPPNLLAHRRQTQFGD